jgi:hypothetical protein
VKASLDLGEMRSKEAELMNFELTDERKLFAEAVCKYACAELEPGSLARAHDPRFPFDVAERMSRQGLLGITLAEEDGGQDGSLMDAVIAIEQVAQACPRSADAVRAESFGPIRTFAPILISFSLSVVSDHSLIGSGVAKVRRKLARL